MAKKTVRAEINQIKGFKMEVKSGNHVCIVDQPLDSGGEDAGPNPLEYLLVALGSCIVTVGAIVAKQQRLPIRNIQAVVEGELDIDVLMGKRSDVRAGFDGIRVHFKVDGDLTQKEKEDFIKIVHSRCPVSDNLGNLTEVSLTVE